MTKQGRCELAKGTAGSPGKQPDEDRQTMRMPYSQIRELISELLTPAPTIDLDDTRPTMRTKKRTTVPPRKPAPRRSSPDELIASLRKSGLREPRR